jgi:AraC family transcriptional regulator, regulatory protein of adaptative response / methylated-DNA-[protein]-cysteine methyltransferase
MNAFAQSKALLEAAPGRRLTSPGSLRDLSVVMEAATPAEFKTRGAGLEIQYGFHSTPFGTCLLGLARRGVCWLSFVEDGHRGSALDQMKSHWSGAVFAEQPDATATLTNRIFSGADRSKSPVNVLVMGTDFQIKVWRALLEIPPGTIESYEALGDAIGEPTACRAIGAAVGQNAVAFLIPCHRVIRKNGLLGGYRWGQPRKQAMLDREAAYRFAAA